MRAAAAVGDDRLQHRARSYVVPDSFTHGSPERRVRWFRRGYDTGDLRQGDTFNAIECLSRSRRNFEISVDGFRRDDSLDLC